MADYCWNFSLKQKQLGMVSKKDRRKLTIASRNECVEIWGYPPGSMPPFGHRRTIRTIIDENLAGTEGMLAVGGGSAYALVQLDAAALLVLSKGEVLAVTKDVEGRIEKHGMLSKRKPGAAAIGAGGGGDAVVGRHGTPLRGSSVDENDQRQLSDLRMDLSWVEEDDGGNGPKKFVVSNEMFRLARWLRVIGIDAAGLPTGGRSKELTDALLIAAHEGRILLTRDKKLASRKDCGASYFVAANSTEAQFKEVQVQFGLTFNDSAFMSRCAVCNSAGFNGPQSSDSIVDAQHGGAIPKGVLETVQEFWECGNASCAKIYWEGPKFSTAHSKFSGLFDPADVTPDATGGLTPKGVATVAAVGRAKKKAAEPDAAGGLTKKQAAK